MNIEEILITCSSFEEILQKLSPLTIDFNILTDDKLSPGEKIFLSLYNKTNKNANLTKKLFVSCKFTRQGADTIYKSLVNKNYIEKVNKENLSAETLKDIVINKRVNNIGSYICSWCGERIDSIDAHHWPLKSSEGGDKTVLICPNCHRLYHAIENLFND